MVPLPNYLNFSHICYYYSPIFVCLRHSHVHFKLAATELGQRASPQSASSQTQECVLVCVHMWAPVVGREWRVESGSLTPLLLLLSSSSTGIERKGRREKGKKGKYLICRHECSLILLVLTASLVNIIAGGKVDYNYYVCICLLKVPTHRGRVILLVAGLICCSEGPFEICSLNFQANHLHG